ncbi:MAG: cytochrome c family protein [Lentisphaeria bacterium]|nr:cytochrome c family protein [Candidatus Neomarinimicrobiota bacterium]MCF7842119.1 cytochrome c family protein [Lentisphaeria bacterium]
MMRRSLTCCLVIGLLAGHSFAQKSASQTVPEVVILDQLEAIFNPVIFQHKLHADMATMGKGCEVCHHNSSLEAIPPCRECHTTNIEEHDLKKPTLNGAYHRQCLNCHKDWEQEQVCESCHTRKSDQAIDVKMSIPDKTDIIGVDHPVIHVPEKQVYNTSHKSGPLVTFHHQEHVELYQYNCVDCHHQESCSTCHEGLKKIAPIQKTLSVHHDPCSSCHETEKATGCSHCHMKKESPGFTHELTGWPLNRFHEALECNACHPKSQSVKALDNTCVNCHTNWFVGNFDHAVTGLELSDSHVYFDCFECHVEEEYVDPPSCETCHDEDIYFPDFLPGDWIK